MTYHQHQSSDDEYHFVPPTLGNITISLNRPARLLMVVNDATFFLSHRLPIALAAREAGLDMSIATAPGPAVGEILRRGLTHHTIPMSRSGIRPDTEVKTLLSLYRLYRQMKPDLVHHVTIKPVLYGGLAARLAGVPGVVTAISGLGSVFSGSSLKSRLIRPLVKRLYRIALDHKHRCVILQNPDDLSLILSMRAITPTDAVLIRGSGVDLRHFHPTPDPPDQTTVVMASRMLRDKGVEVFVQAAKLLKMRSCQIRCVLVGDPDPDNPDSVSASQLQHWHAEGHVEWWGRQGDMQAVFSQAHIVCLPTHYGEGVPKVLLEGAACGKPLVATDAPGCREVVIHDVNGLLVPVRDPGALADALERLACDPSLRTRMGKESRIIAETAFGQDSVVQKHLKIYRSLLAGMSNPRQETTKQPGSETSLRPDTDVLRLISADLLHTAGYSKLSWNGAPIKVSRNTIIQRGLADQLPILAKMSRNSIGDAARGELAMYRTLAQHLEVNDQFSVPRAIAANPEHGILVTEYIDGVSADLLLLKYARTAHRLEDQTMGLARVSKTLGSALRWFHDEWDEAGELSKVRLYLDFSPRNILLRSVDGRIVFIDPPASAIVGQPERDIGIALFELSRVLLRILRPRTIKLWSGIRLAFLDGYNSGSLPDENGRGMALVHREEYQHLWRVIKRYLYFWRFPDWPRQAFRAMVILPPLLVLRFILLPLYHRRERRTDPSQQWLP